MQFHLEVKLSLAFDTGSTFKDAIAFPGAGPKNMYFAKKSFLMAKGDNTPSKTQHPCLSIQPSKYPTIQPSKSQYPTIQASKPQYPTIQASERIKAKSFEHIFQLQLNFLSKVLRQKNIIIGNASFSPQKNCKSREYFPCMQMSWTKHTDLRME